MSIISISGRIGSGKDTVGKISQIISSCPQLNNEAVEAWLKRDLPKPEYEIQKWANSLKDIVCILIGCTREQLEDHEYKETELGEEWWYYQPSNVIYPYNEVNRNIMVLEGSENYYLEKPTPRKLLQLIGTDLFRNQLHPNIWVNSLMSKYKPFGLPPEEERVSVGDETVVLHIHSPEWYPNWIITDTRFPNELKAVKDKGGISIRVIRPNYEEVIEPLHASETALDNAEFDYEISNDKSIIELIEKVREILTKERIINN